MALLPDDTVRTPGPCAVLEEEARDIPGEATSSAWLAGEELSELAAGNAQFNLLAQADEETEEGLSNVENNIEVPRRQAAGMENGESLPNQSDQTARVDAAQTSFSAARRLSVDLSPASETAAEVSTHRSTEAQGFKELRKQVFILSDSGKPIYSRYGNEQDFATVTPLLQTLVSIVQADKNELQSITTSSCKFVFLHRTPLTVVVVSRGHESVSQLQQQLNYIHNQIVSLLTETQLKRIAEQRSNFDFRRLLSDVERSYDTLLNMMSNNPCFMLNAVKCLPLPSGVRDTISGAISSCASKNKNLVFVILIAGDQVITIGRMKSVTMHPVDLHLIINLVASSLAFRSYAEGLWIPVCLPRFNNSGYLHTHISYLSDSCPACLLLLNVDKFGLIEMTEISKKIVEKLSKAKAVDAITEACAKNGFTVSEVGIPELIHFLYKNRSSSQYTGPELEMPYTDELEQERLFGVYLSLHHQIHSNNSLTRLMYWTGDREAVLGWVTAKFELYAAFSPLVTKIAAISSVEKIMKWLVKEEGRLFLTNPAVF